MNNAIIETPFMNVLESGHDMSGSCANLGLSLGGYSVGGILQWNGNVRPCDTSHALYALDFESLESAVRSDRGKSNSEKAKMFGSRSTSPSNAMAT